MTKPLHGKAESEATGVSDDQDEWEERPKSKSQVKRDMQVLRDIGKQLIAMTPAAFNKVPASERLQDAVEAARGFKRRALSRQIGRLGVLLREEDVDAIQHTLEQGVTKPHQEEVQALHESEQWRDRLLAGDNELLNQLVGQHAADRQHLRQLLRNANKEKSHDKPPRSARLLFQYLRELNR